MGYMGFEIEITDWRRKIARLKGINPSVRFRFSSAKDLRKNFRKTVDTFLGGNLIVKSMDGKE